MVKNISSLFVLLFLLFSCASDKVATQSYKTKYVIVVVMDGPRFSETWGDPAHENIPYMDSALSPNGIVHQQFYNLGETFTTNGHTAITTGFYQKINNSGQELPSNPSIFQHILRNPSNSKEAVWIVASKDKLAVLANCSQSGWKDKFLPSTDCGVNGNGTGYREDSITVKNVLSLLSEKQPTFLLVNFKEPDYSGHQANWPAYLKGIQSSDAYIYEIWKFIQNDPFYKDKTTLFVTNDHGRHLNTVSSGFVSHGDGCDGCRHINLFSYGPDFKSGIVSEQPRSLVDIHATILELLHIRNAETDGKVMRELFKD